MNFQNQIEYGRLHEFDVLSGVKIPAPFSTDTLKSHIMLRCGLLTPLYSEPETMRAAITHWFNYMDYDISKMVELALTEYLPLENYRRTESETRDQWITNDKTNTGTDTLAHTGTDTMAHTGTDTMAHTGTIDDSGGETTTDTGTITDEYTSNNEHTVSAYNESTYSPDNKDEGGGDNERTLDTKREVTRGNTRTFLNNDTRTRADTDTRTRADTDTRTLNLADNGIEHNADKVDRLVYGNIGTMTTQDMFNQELDLLDRFNPYSWIVGRLEAELFLGIW